MDSIKKYSIIETMQLHNVRHSDLYYIKVYSECIILGSTFKDCKIGKNRMTFLLLHSMNCEY